MALATVKSPIFDEVRRWLLPDEVLFTGAHFHGNTKWNPNQLATQAMIWSWQEAKNVTDAFDQASEVCSDLGMEKVANNYIFVFL